MALQKTKKLYNGIVTNYHKIDNITIRPNYLEIHVASFADEDYRRDALENAIDGEYYFFEVDLSELESKDIYSLAYEKIKTVEDFLDAIDC